MSCWQKSKLVGPLLLFNILLPTWDVLSDVKLSVNLIIGGKQVCLIEEENVQAFKQELDLCLQNSQEYCQSDSVASYLCQDYSPNPSCLECDSFNNWCSTGECSNTNTGITEIFHRCLQSTYDYYRGDNFTGNVHASSRHTNYYCSDPNTYHGICEEVTRRHYKFAILLLGIHSKILMKDF